MLSYAENMYQVYGIFPLKFISEKIVRLLFTYIINKLWLWVDYNAVDSAVNSARDCFYCTDLFFIIFAFYM